MRGSNEGDKQGASSATSPSPLTSRPLFLALYLFLSRVLESGRILTRRGSYSSLDPVHSVALSSRLRPSSSPHLRTSFSRKASPFLTTTTKTKTRSRSATLSSRLAPFSIRLSLLSLSLVTSALDIVFSSHSLSSRTFILILPLSLVLSRLKLLPLAHRLVLPPSSSTFALSLPPPYLPAFLAQRTSAHFFLLPTAPTLIHVDISARRTNRPTDDCWPREGEERDESLSCRTSWRAAPRGERTRERKGKKRRTTD